MTQVLDAIRCVGEANFFSPDELPTPASVDQVLAKIRFTVEAAAGSISLRDLADPAQRIRATPEPPPSSPAGEAV